jgi:hypothetical protein
MTQYDEASGVRVVLSAPQLGAVLSGQSISPTEMLSNRLWGGLQVLGGVLEMAGASVLCVAPEPTGLTKLGCVAFGVHGSDTAAAGLRQVWTGQDTAMLTQQGTRKLVEVMKAPPEMANHIGLSLDIAAPFGLAGMVKAARVSHVTMGRIKFMRHEATAANPRLGGHTLKEHVGKDEAYLRERLARNPRMGTASSFTDLNIAEWSANLAFEMNKPRISAWAFSPSKRDLILTIKAGKDVGYGVVRQTGKMESLRGVLIIFRKEPYNGMPYYIFTAYPIK